MINYVSLNDWKWLQEQLGMNVEDRNPEYMYYAQPDVGKIKLLNQVIGVDFFDMDDRIPSAGEFCRIVYEEIVRRDLRRAINGKWNCEVVVKEPTNPRLVMTHVHWKVWQKFLENRFADSSFGFDISTYLSYCSNDDGPESQRIQVGFLGTIVNMELINERNIWFTAHELWALHANYVNLAKKACNDGLYML